MSQWGFPYTSNPIPDGIPANAPRWWQRLLSVCNTWMAAVGSSGWQSPTYAGAWADFNAGYQVGGFQLINGMVYLQGLVAGGAIGAIFTLPVGFRPLYPQIFTQIADGPSGTQVGGARITVNTNGSVALTNYFGSGDNAFVTLTGIYFDQGG